MPLYDRRCACGWTQLDVFEPIITGAQTCPRCGLVTSRCNLSGASRVNGDECDIWQENGFPEPQHFTSKRALRRALAEKGLEQRVTHHTLAGTDKHPQTTDWSRGSIDPYTLAAATALVSRMGVAGKTDETPEPNPFSASPFQDVTP